MPTRAFQGPNCETEKFFLISHLRRLLANKSNLITGMVEADGPLLAKLESAIRHQARCVPLFALISLSSYAYAPATARLAIRQLRGVPVDQRDRIAFDNLQGEVALLRELVALLFAQLPHTQPKVDAMHGAMEQARLRLSKESPGYISVAHAWNQQVERMKRYGAIPHE